MTGLLLAGDHVMTRTPSSCNVSSAPIVGVAALICLLFSSCGLFRTAVGVGMVKLRFGCLVEGTRIDTPTGPVAVEDLETGDLVIGYGGDPVAIQQVHQYQEDAAASRHLTISFSDGAEIQLSRLHRVNGIPAGQFEVGDRIDGRLVTGVSSLSGVSRSFDLLTDDQGYRIHGVPVNSMIEEMAGR